MEELHLTTNGDEIDEWQCSKCGAAVDERWNCCEVHEQTSSRGEVYFQCEDCDSTYMYDPLNCEFCSSPHMIKLALPPYS